MSTVCSPNRIASGENDVEIRPYWWKPDGSKRAIVYVHHLGGTPAPTLDPAVLPGFNSLLRYLGQFTLVLVADLGGTTYGYTPFATRLASVQTLLGTTAVGARNDKLLLLGISHGGAAVFNYTVANPSNVAAAAGILPESALDDARNFNRPNGWTGTTQNAPANTSAVNFAFGLATNSTADYPTHGTSFAALPSGYDPATLTWPGSVPGKAWYAANDSTVPQATVTAKWPNPTAIPGAADHTDTTVGLVDKEAVLAFFQPYI